MTCRVRSTSDWSATVEETVELASTPIPSITTTELTRTGDEIVVTTHDIVDLTTIPADIRKRFVDEVGSDWPARVDELIANGTLQATDVVSTEKAIDGVHDAPPYCAELSGVFMSAENVPGRPAAGGLREFQFVEATVSVGADDVPVAIRGSGYEAKITAWAAG